MSGVVNLRVVDELPRAVDCVVIGGGILGAATAFSTQRAGLATLLVERRSALATLTTAAATGGFRAQFDDPDEMALARESIAVFERFADEIGIAGYDIGFQRRGYLWVTTDGATARRQRDLVARQRAWGLDDVELIEGVELRRRFPYLAPAVVAGRFRAADGFMAPPAIAIGYARAAG
ncbi:MAG: NAD(P)/FAD-dependent oxidoreductase, partial [Vulcanimicrobiaceae bacterium]